MQTVTFVAVCLFGGIVLTKNRKVVKFRKKINIGTIIIGVICFYILVYTGLYFFKDKTSIYRVVSDIRPDVIKNTGIIIRKERVFNAEKSGYINYYVNNNSITRKKGIVYTLDATGSFYSKLKNQENNNSETELISVLRQFQLNKDNNFYNVYNLKDSIKEVEISNSGRLLTSSLKKELAAYKNDNSLYINYADDSGVVVYSTDGFENITLDTLNASTFEKMDSYTLKSPVSSGKVNAGEPVYKLITDEKWQIAVPIDESQKKMLKGVNFVDAVIDNKSFSARAEVETSVINNKNYVILTFYNYMINYTNKRFVDVYITLRNVSGLKIPKSSVVERQVFEIPKKFLVQGGSNFNSAGFTKVVNNRGVEEGKFIETDICYIGKDFVYITDDNDFKAGDELVAPKSNEHFIISKTKMLKGIYNVNKGYPRFKHVEPVEINNSDYYLIPDTKGFLLYEYDNIMIQVSKV